MLYILLRINELVIDWIVCYDKGVFLILLMKGFF